MDDLQLVIEAGNKKINAGRTISNNSFSLNGLNVRHIQSNMVSSGTAYKYNKCYTARNLFDIFSIGDVLNKTSFPELCSSLVYMTVKSSCQNAEAEESLDKPTAAQSMLLNLIIFIYVFFFFNLFSPFFFTIEYIYGTIAIVIISLIALVGIFLLPCFGRSIYDKILIVLTALAAGTLFSDAMLHIIPEVNLV
jgi:hypothetical protein